MQIEKILDSEYVSEKKLGEEFYFVSSSEENSTLIKKLFLKLHYKNKFTSSVLTYGLLATLELSLDKNFTIIKQFMDKNNIAIDSDILTNALTHPLEGKEEQSFSAISQFMKTNNVQPDKQRLTKYILNLIESKRPISTVVDFWKSMGIDTDKDLSELQIIYNFANAFKRVDLAQELNEKFGIIRKSLMEDMGEYISFVEGAHSSFGSLQSNGVLSMGGCMGGELDPDTEKQIYYQVNPFLLNLKYFNSEKLDSYLQESEEISHSLITHAVVRSIFYGNNDSVLYLFSKPQCAEIIKNSPELKDFINSNEGFESLQKNKLEARICLEKILNDPDSKSKNKI